MTLRPALLHAVALMAALASCAGTGHSNDDQTDSLHVCPDTLRVGTLYSPTSYFLYREEAMGYDYDMVSRLAADKGMALKLTVAPSLGAVVEMLDSGLIDLVAYEVPVTADYRSRVVACGVESVTHQVLVQPRKSAHPVTDVTQLVGREVWVERGSKYHQRMANLNDELGGGIIIKPIDRDTLITEDLIAMVSQGDIPLTVVDSDIARLNKTYYPDLDITLELSFPQRAAWGVAPGKEWLADTINAWISGEKPRNARAALLKRYFEMGKDRRPTSGGIHTLNLSSGHVSPFDHLFRRASAELGWDWRLIASQGYAESKFDSTQVSWAGARGVMQIMPRTARAYGLTEEMMTHNDASITTAVKIMASLERSFARRVPDPDERRKFVVAAYNSGLAHILDAIALAEKYGKDPTVWDGNVAQALLMKSKPEYYNDPVCKYGYFRGRQTFDYVNNVFALYHAICEKIK